MSKRYKNIVFDLDGTLIDSAGDICACLEKSFVEITGSVARITDKTWLGLPLKEIVVAANPGLHGDELATVCACFRKTYDSSDYPNTVLMPGVLELIPQFLREGMALFVATNKPIKPTLRIISRLGMAEWFKEIVSPDSIPERKMSKPEMLAYLMDKWKLDRKATLMVGDSEPDVIAARDNGVACAYLTSGYGSTAGMRAIRPDVLLSDMQELRKIA